MNYQCRNCGTLYGCEATKHEWESVCSHCGQLLWLRPGDSVVCKVTKLSRFGIFVELNDNVEGLIHISELTSRKIGHPEEVVGVDSAICAKVLRVDVRKRKIGLSRRRLFC